MEYTTIEAKGKQSSNLSDDAIAGFLFMHLDQYGDPLVDIKKCLEYMHKKGGFAIVAHEGKSIKGAVVVNETGMSKYIPENILVYIAVDASTRGQGVGKELMKRALDTATGDVALHVEPDNPARRLYEGLGFTNKYLEMRYAK
jgi:ribosomal protein S18 acetylase RimI-like enzyme